MQQDVEVDTTVGVLCLHGFASSPAFMRFTRQALEEAGFVVSCPALPGHGTTPEDLERTDRQAWIEAVRAALGELRARCSQVFVVGHSMGATLAMHLAVEDPQLGGLVLLAPSVKVATYIRVGVALLGRVRRWVSEPPIAIMDPVAREDPALRDYSRIPVRALRENLRMKADSSVLPARITVPALLVEGRHDPLVSRGSAHAIAAALASSNKYVVTAYRSSHGLPVDYDKDYLHRITVDFIRGCRPIGASE